MGIALCSDLPGPYIYAVYDRIFGDVPANNTVYTPHICGYGQPTLCTCRQQWHYTSPDCHSQWCKGSNWADFGDQVPHTPLPWSLFFWSATFHQFAAKKQRTSELRLRCCWDSAILAWQWEPFYPVQSHHNCCKFTLRFCYAHVSNVSVCALAWPT